MPSSQFPSSAVRVARVRPRSRRAIAQAAGLLALVFALNTGCRTPWSIEPLPVDQLEAGMDPNAVRRVLGEPEWIDSIGEKQPPTTSPGSDTATDSPLVTAWGYQDERVDPVGLFFAGLFLPVYAPVYLMSLAFPVDPSERDCVWTDERWIDLYFEDDRLAEWIVTPQPPRGWCDNSGGYYSTWSGYWGPYPWTYARYHHHSKHHHGHQHHDRGDHHDDGDPGGPGDHADRPKPDGSGSHEDSHDRDDRPRTGEHQEHRDSGSRDVAARHRDSGSHGGSNRNPGVSRQRGSSSHQGFSSSRGTSSSRGSGGSRGSGRPRRPDR